MTPFTRNRLVSLAALASLLGCGEPPAMQQPPPGNQPPAGNPGPGPNPNPNPAPNPNPGTGAPMQPPPPGGAPAQTPPGNVPPVQPPTSIDWNTISAAATDAYLRKLSPIVVGRVLSSAERQQITMLKGKAIEPIVTAWVSEPAFVDATRRFVEDMLAVSGKLADPRGAAVDFGLPVNLGAFLVKNNRPWSEMITAADCYDAQLRPMKCDSGAPYGAGVLTTRAILLSRSGRFNLTRASTLIRTFACQSYPLEADLQPYVDKTWLLPMFQANTPEEQVDERAKNGFGNGLGCYSCHGQFSLHAQLFVKFDGAGFYKAGADGMQDTRPEAELGRATMTGLLASHFKDRDKAGLEGVQLFGKPVANLAEATKVLAQHPLFTECAANKYLDHTLGVLSGHVKYDRDMFREIGYRARLRKADPTLGDIVQSLFTHPTVVQSMIASLTGGAR
jgi:hypothetical protein